MSSDQDQTYSLEASDRRKRKWLIFITTCVAGAAIFAGAFVFMSSQRESVVEDCYAYSAPASQVVCEFDPKNFQVLLATDPQIVKVKYDSTVYGSGTMLARTAVPWQQLRQMLDLHPSKPMATLYLHERQTRGGQRVLVVAEAGVDDDYLAIYTAVLPESSLRFGNLGQKVSFEEHPGYGLAFLQPTLRIMPGRSDPQDSSRFAIPFADASSQWMIEGHVTEALKIELTPENPVSAAIPPPAFPFPQTARQQTAWGRTSRYPAASRPAR